MAPKLDLRKKPAANIRRLATKHIDRALESVDAIIARADPAAVHDVRTRSKRLRAIARMARPRMGRAYRRENAAFRNLARELGDARDAQVLVTTFDDLLTWASPDVDGKSYADIRARLGEHALGATKELEETADERGERVRRGFLDARDRVADWPLGGLDRADVVAGVVKNYRQGRTALRVAAETDEPAAFHEWRKRAKYSWYHAQILEPLAPNLLNATADAYHELSSLLGDDHDLAVFVAMISAQLDGMDERCVAELVRLAERRRRALESDALSRGEKIYGDKPKRIRKELVALWNAAA